MDKFCYRRRYSVVISSGRVTKGYNVCFVENVHCGQVISSAIKALWHAEILSDFKYQ